MQVKKAVSLFYVSILISAIFAACLIFVYAQVIYDPDLEDSQATQNGNFIIHYTDGVPNSHPNKEITLAEVNDLDFQLEDIFDLYTDPTGNFMFYDPTGGTVMPVQVFPTDGGGKALRYLTPGGDRWIELSPDIFDNPLSVEGIPLHEMLHHVQWEYGFDWSLFVAEGTARMMQDKLYNDLDQSNGNEMCAYRGEANDFLDGLTDRTLTAQSYAACLFWTYFCEQYGTVTGEPWVGVDAIRVLFENYDSGSDDIQRLNAALNTLSPGTTFQDLFMDFIMANYAKDLTGVNVPDEYQYLDDDQPPGRYNSPRLTFSQNMAPGDTYIGTEPMNPWSAKYFEANIGANVPIISVDFHQAATSLKNLVYNLLVIENDDLVLDVCEFNQIGKNFKKSIVNRDFDQVVVIVGALDHSTTFDYSISTVGDVASLDILSPKTDAVEIVDVDDLTPFIATLEVQGPAGPVSGLEPDDFQVTVDSSSFNIITGLEVMGQYWLVIEPEDLGLGLYDLQVDLVLGTLTDIETDAVEFADTVNVDSVIVIDRSGSMLEPDWTGPFWEPPQSTDKIYGAIDGATVYVNSFRTGDMLGLVWFSNDAYVERTLGDFTEANRVDFINVLDTFDQDQSGAWLATSIGDGLDEAQDELNFRGAADHSSVIVLLSDGLENQDLMIDAVVGPGKKVDPAFTIINTIALGSNADREKLEKLAVDSGGTFLYVMEPASGDLPNDLADAYRLFAETSLKEQRIAAIRGTHHTNQTETIHTIDVESGSTEATFVVNFNWAGLKDGGKPDVTLVDPLGNNVNPTYVDDKHNFYRVPFPQDGTWTIKLSTLGVWLPRFEANYLIEASVKSKIQFKPFLGVQPENQKIGMGLPILAFLTDTKPITGARVEVEIRTPDLNGTIAILPGEIYNIELFDDGSHGDGIANDGVYGNTFYNTYRYGIYDMKFTAEGSSEVLGNFMRESKIAFNMRSDTDSDGDGLPDSWEESVGLDPNNPFGEDGSIADPDGDGLTNEEEFKNGTFPLNPDSDGGGENDGSEVFSGKDPNNPKDDSVKPPTSLRVIPGIGNVTLLTGFLPEHDLLVVYKATHPNGNWESFEIEAANPYVDSDVENDVTYYYKVVGAKRVGEQTHFSIPTRVVSGTPRTDPIPPSGYVQINEGDFITNTEQVMLTIRTDPDTVEMKVSNTPNFEDVEWETISASRSWDLIPGKGVRTVYLILKDTAGNIGPRSSYDPSVDVQPAKASIILREIEGVPESFLVDVLRIEPSSGKIGEFVNISINVMNTGGKEGVCPVQLKIDGVLKDEVYLTLLPNERQTQVFKVISEHVGTCNVDVNGLQGSFVVEEASIPWLWIVLIVLAIIVVVIPVWIFRRKR